MTTNIDDETKPAMPALSVQVFGEKTSLPISVTKAVVRATDPLPFVNHSSVSLELSLTNKAVNKDNVAAKLQLSLPVGASVKKFEIQRNAKWYPATAVPKKKAKTVVYKEREKGRAVAAVSNAAAATNIFEIEVSPLPFEQETLCRLEIVVTEGSTSTEELIGSLRAMATDDNETEVLVETIPVPRPAVMDAKAGAIVGDSFGKTHFLCKVPTLAPSTDETITKNKLDHVAIVWDASASTAAPSVDARCSRLKNLLVAGQTRTVELYTFGMGTPQKIGVYDKVDELLQAIQGISHDGGSDFSTLPPLVSELAKATATVDAVLVFTDGVDNLGRTPVFENSTDISFPVHSIADTTGTIHLRNLKTIAAASPRATGAVLTKKDDNYLNGILFPRPVLHSIVVDQDQDAFLEETDDGFRCVPDHRLQVLNEPIPAVGLLISGIISGHSSVTKLTANVMMGTKAHTYHFQLRAPVDDESTMEIDGQTEKEATTTLTCPTVFLKPEENNPTARILGHIYAAELYHQAEAFGIRSGLSTERVREQLAVSYGFCSPESSLLMLYEKEQFVEHGILPAVDHPAAGEMPPPKEEKDGSAEAYKPGEVGGLKNEQQKDMVASLALRLKQFVVEPPNKKLKSDDTDGGDCQERQQSANMGRGGGGGMRALGGFVAQHQSRQMNVGECFYGGEEEECAASGDLFGGAGNMCGDGVDYDEEDDEGGEECDMFGGAGDLFGKADYDEEDDEGEEECGDAPDPRLADILLLDGPARFSAPSGGFSSCAPPVSTGQERRRERRSGGAREEEKAEVPGDVSCLPLPPNDPVQYIEALEVALTDSNDQAWKELYQTELQSLGGHGSASPSFFLNSARVLIKQSKPDEAVRVAGNCLESGIDDTQMLRSVGYLLLSAETAYGWTLAVELFEKVKELAPLEPQSFMDICLARFWKAWNCFGSLETTATTTNNDEVSHFLRDNLTRVQEGLVHIMTHCWAQRFAEVEWPALILLHYVAELSNQVNQRLSLDIPDWPAELLSSFDKQQSPEDATARPDAGLRCIEFDPTLMVWLAWDTDHTDVDLHVIEPSKKEIYYGNKRGTGSLMSRDFTQGYGPEVYIAKNGAADPGKYEVHAKYYSSHQDSALTGTTSAVVWTIEVVDGKKQVKFSFVRLNTKKEKTHVATAVVGDPMQTE